MTNEYLAGFDCLGVKETVGKTRLGRDINLYHGGQNAKVLLVAGVHGREHITCDLLRELARAEGKGLAIDYLPILNTDGVLLAKYGLDTVGDSSLKRKLIAFNNGRDDFSQWKANAYGVDINVNFDADWGEGRQNVTFPGAANYIGSAPTSEPETLCAVKVLEREYSLVVCYHSLGEEVYWGYDCNFRHYEEARRYADFVGYKLKRSEYSCGGMKDYYALHYAGLGLTVEVGEEKYGQPYPPEKLDLILQKHKGSLRLLTEIGDIIYGRIHEGGIDRSAKSIR